MHLIIIMKIFKKQHLFLFYSIFSSQAARGSRMKAGRRRMISKVIVRVSHVNRHYIVENGGKGTIFVYIRPRVMLLDLVPRLPIFV